MAEALAVASHAWPASEQELPHVAVDLAASLASKGPACLPLDANLNQICACTFVSLGMHVNTTSENFKHLGDLFGTK
eukprot:4383131-Amphidinium_carterae.1